MEVIINTPEKIYGYYLSNKKNGVVKEYKNYKDALKDYYHNKEIDNEPLLLIARMTKFENLNPMILGMDTTVSPFKENYVALKKLIGVYIDGQK